MSRIGVHRPARITPPAVPDTKVVLSAPPQLANQNSAGSMVTLLLPLLSSLAMAGYMISVGNPLLIVLGIVFVLTAIGVTFGMRWQVNDTQRKSTSRQRFRYQAHLAVTRDQARAVASTQRLLAAWTHPSPQRLWAIATTRQRVWERRQSDPDFLQVRLGLGHAELATPLQLGLRADPMADYDRDSGEAAQDLIERFGRVSRQPVVLDLGSAGVASLIGRPEQTSALARAMVCQVAVLHAPDDVLIALCTNGSPEWDWAKWLPHTFEPHASGEAGVVPLVADDPADIADFLERELVRRMALQQARRSSIGFDRAAAPHQQRLLLVIDRFDPRSEWGRSGLFSSLVGACGPQVGMTIVCLVDEEAQEPTRVEMRARLGPDDGLQLEGRSNLLPTTVSEPIADQLDPRLAELTARALAPLRLSDEQEQVLARTVSLPEMLLGSDLDNADIAAGWLGAADPHVLRVPIGTGPEGEVVTLDLKESAQGGIGPHGLIVGATGSGKSELLRTLVTGLALTHSPDLLGFVLIDFKGGATFAPLTDLPHVSGLITNLADDLALVDRVQAALQGEQQRRQRMLRDAGNVDSIRDYQMRRAAGVTDAKDQPLEPLPYLLIVVDEFGELLSRRPDFIDLFGQIGRVGRSLGMHLLLATQRLEEGRLRGLESHLSYRMCLRTFSVAESRTVIGTSDAYELPPIPGSAYLKAHESIYQRFRVAHVSAPRLGADELAAPVDRTTVLAPYNFRQAPAVEADDSRSSRPAELVTGPTEMQVVVERLKWLGQPVHQVWLPPLPQALSLDAVLGPLSVQPGQGLTARHWPSTGQLKVPVAVVDIPLRQEQRPLVLDFGGLHGHVAVVGAPQSGKSTVLRTIVLAGALTHTPEAMHCYCVDFGGGSLHALATLPHVGTVAGRRDQQLVRRTLAEIRGLINERERQFRELGIDSVAEFRTRRASGRLPKRSGDGDVFLVIDNWGAVRTEIEDADPLVAEIATRGLGAGVHVVLSSNRWLDLRGPLRDSIGTRLELRLNDPTESEVGRQLAQALPAGTPGRGLVAPGAYFQVALPRLDGRDTTDGMREAQEDALGKVDAAWTGPPAPPIRVLPDRIDVRDMAVMTGQTHGVPIGIAEADLKPVDLDLTTGDPHLLVFGDAGSGKTAFLRTWARGLARQHSDSDARMVVVDYRRGLLGAIPEDHLAAYAWDAETAKGIVDQVVERLRERLAPSDVTPRQLRERSWWEGPEVYVVVDDYDLVGGGAQAPLAGLGEFLPQARDVGLHLVLARRVGGASRMLMSDPLMVRMSELGCGGLVLSGDPKEGYLVGEERAAPRPPGRGRLVRRNHPGLVVQIALDEDEADEVARSGAAPGDTQMSH